MSTTAKKGVSKIIWAVDAYGDPLVTAQTARTLRALVAKVDATIEPVYVLTPDQVNVSPAVYPEWKKSYGAVADLLLRSQLGEVKIEKLKPAQIAASADETTRDAVGILTRYAADHHGDLIALSTHARKGISRFILGSFAETLVLQSRIPVLITNPETKVPERIERILFPSDFSQRSRRGFEQAVDLAKQLGAELVLFYKAQAPIPMGLPVAPIVYDYAAEEVKMYKQLAPVWADWAKKRGVETRLVFDERPGDIPEAIIAESETQKCSLVAMVAQMGPVSSVVLGSNTRKVLRGARCPVWVLHHQA